MPYWQCEYALIPKSLSTWVDNTPLLKGSGIASDESDLVQDNLYWESSPMTDANAALIQSVLKRTESWTELAWMFGTKGLDEAELWTDMIFWRIDSRNINRLVLNAMVFMAISLDCVFVNTWTGAVIDAEIEAIELDIASFKRSLRN